METAVVALTLHLRPSAFVSIDQHAVPCGCSPGTRNTGTTYGEPISLL